MNYLVRSVAVLGAVLMFSTTSANAQMAPFGQADDVAFAKHLWQTMVNNRLVGAKAFRPMPYETAPPHGNIVETLDGRVVIDGRSGVVIVKKNMGKRGETTLEQAANSPEKYVTSITAMFKREKGYDPENKDWFWVKYTPAGEVMKNPKGMSLAGRVAKGADKGCIACHTAAPGGDMVYIHDRYAK